MRVRVGGAASRADAELGRSAGNSLVKTALYGRDPELAGRRRPGP